MLSLISLERGVLVIWPTYNQRGLCRAHDVRWISHLWFRVFHIFRSLMVLFYLWAERRQITLIVINVCRQCESSTGRHDRGGRALRQHRGGGDGGREFHPVPGGETYVGRPAEDHPQQPQKHRRGYQQGTARLPVHPERREQPALSPHLLPWWAAVTETWGLTHEWLK